MSEENKCIIVVASAARSSIIHVFCEKLQQKHNTRITRKLKTLYFLLLFLIAFLCFHHYKICHIIAQKTASGLPL